MDSSQLRCPAQGSHDCLLHTCLCTLTSSAALTNLMTALPAGRLWMRRIGCCGRHTRTGCRRCWPPSLPCRIQQLMQVRLEAVRVDVMAATPDNLLPACLVDTAEQAGSASRSSVRRVAKAAALRCRLAAAGRQGGGVCNADSGPLEAGAPGAALPPLHCRQRHRPQVPMGTLVRTKSACASLSPAADVWASSATREQTDEC